MWKWWLSWSCVYLLLGAISNGLLGQTTNPTAVASQSEPSREESFKRFQDKISAGEPLVVHALVALCDNEHQGIIPVNDRLGDGTNLKTNLYWGALYGVSHHFGRSAKWKHLKTVSGLNSEILERRVFYRVFPNGAKVFLVADAFRGDAMKACLVNFFDAVSGRKSAEFLVGKETLGVGGAADLIVFNGHNGLMDFPNLRFLRSADQRLRETAVIGCLSQEYFNPHLKIAGGYPLLMTTNLMAPEAYVLEALISSWATEADGEAIRKAVGAAYHQYQQCGINGATRLFHTGW